MKKKIALVIQRCGKEVNGGAEDHCFMVAKHLKPYVEVEILSTCALDYMTWDNHYPSGCEVIEGVPVRRFKVDRPRNVAEFNRCSENLSNREEITTEEAQHWVNLQGPLSSSLTDYISKSKNNYDAFIFFTYLYATTVNALPEVAEKAFLVPTAHDEWPIYLPVYDDLFNKPQALIFNTPSEKSFIEKRFPNIVFNDDIVGVGIDFPGHADALRFRNKNNIWSPFIFYLGRIDESKGCRELFDFYIQYAEEYPQGPKLITAGKKVMAVPIHPNITHLGFIDDQAKYDAIAACDMLINPSPFESLSIVLLEAWTLNRPTIVTSKCEVLVDQSRRSGAGLWYGDYQEFKKVINKLTRYNPLPSGQHFVSEYYSWEVIVNKYLNILENN